MRVHYPKSRTYSILSPFEWFIASKGPNLYILFFKTRRAMILKLGLKHQAMELYKVYINHDLGMTFTCFMAMSTLVAYAFEWGK